MVISLVLPHNPILFGEPVNFQINNPDRIQNRLLISYCRKFGDDDWILSMNEQDKFMGYELIANTLLAHEYK